MKKSVLIAVIAAALAIHVQPTAAQTVSSALTGTPRETPPLSAYGALPSLEAVQVSPSGERIARVTVVDETRVIAVMQLETGESLAMVRVGESKVRDLTWIDDDQVLVTASEARAIPFLGVPLTELTFGVILDVPSGRVIRALDRTEGVLPVLTAAPILRRTDDGATLFLRGAPVQSRDMNLYRVDSRNGRGRRAYELDRDIRDVVLDTRGELIAMSRYSEARRTWTLLTVDKGGRMRSVWATDATLDPPRLLGLGRTDRTVLVAAERTDLPDDQTATTDQIEAIFEIDIETGVWSRLPLNAHFLVRHPRTDLIVGYGRRDEDGVHYDFFEPTAQRRWAAIARAFDQKRPQLISWNDDLTKVVVFTDIGESGLYQIVDFDSGTADILGSAYPDITDDQVGAVRPLTYAARDGLEIHGFLTLPPGTAEARDLPLIVLAHGGPAARDVMAFDWWAQALASRGYAVLQANFRGSTGYGRAFMEAGYGQWGRAMQTDLSDGVNHLARQDLIDPARVCIVGASYGGYAALAGPTLDRGVYRCAVSVNGVSDLRRMVNQEAREGERRDNQAVRYWNRFMGAAGLNDRALDALSPAHLADQADAPVLLIHGRDDTVAPIEQSRVMADALRRAGKTVQLIELDGEDHWLSQADTRRQMLTATVDFLQTHNPTGQIDPILP